MLGLVLASIAVAFLGKAAFADSRIDRERCGRMANASAQAECYRSLVERDHIGSKAEYERCLRITPPTGRANCFRALLREKVRDKAAAPPTPVAKPPPTPAEVSSPPAAAAAPPPAAAAVPPPPAPGSPGTVEETVYGFLEHRHLFREGDRKDLGYAVAIALATMLAVAAVVVFARKWMFLPHRTAEPDDERRWSLEVDDPTLRDAQGDLERPLAVEEQKAVRPLEIERNVSRESLLADALREEKAEAERKLVATSEALNQTKTALGQAQARLSEQLLEAKDFALRYERLKDIKATLEQSLAARTEALARVEASANDLRARLAEAENTRQETVSRLEASRAEAGDLHIKCARLQQTLDQVTKQSEEILGLLEASANDLRARLAEAENARQETVSRLEASRAEAGDLHIKCARLQETLDQVTKQSEEILALLNRTLKNPVGGSNFY